MAALAKRRYDDAFQMKQTDITLQGLLQMLGDKPQVVEESVVELTTNPEPPEKLMEPATEATNQAQPSPRDDRNSWPPEHPVPKVDQLRFLRRAFSGPYITVRNFITAYGPCCHVQFPGVTHCEWLELTSCFPELGRLKYPSNRRHPTLSFRLDQLGQDSSLECTLLLRPTYSRQHLEVLYDEASSREYSVYKGGKLIVRTAVSWEGHCSWGYRCDSDYSNVLKYNQPHKNPLLLLEQPVLVRYLKPSQIAAATSKQCQCFDCALLDLKYPCLFKGYGDLPYQYPGIVPLLQNCNACRKQLTGPSFRDTISMHLYYQQTVLDVVSSFSPPVENDKTDQGKGEEAARGWFQNQSSWLKTNTL